MLARTVSTHKLLFVLGVVALLIGMAFLTTPVSAQSFEPTEGLLVIHVTYELKPGMTPPPTTVLLTGHGGKPLIGSVNPDGYFSIFLPPGTYVLDISAKGFSPFLQKEVAIDVGKTTTLTPYMSQIP